MARLLAGRYELGARLGSGGMAEVVRGLDVRLRRPVAVKLVPADRVDAAARERFRREAMSSAGFSHAHAVTTYDAGEDAGWLYLVMELVEGRTLAEHLATVGALDPDEAVRITGAVLDALAAAHAAGLVHRDVKPGNVLLGAGGTVKLADFGIARRFDDVTHEVTTVGTFIGTARYASPEQLAGKPATPASDVYSTGVVLYEMLTGRPPFDADSAVAIAMAHHSAPVPDVRAAAPSVPSALAAVVARAMAKEPAERFESAGAMRAALASRTAAAPGMAPLAAPLPATAVAPAARSPAPGRQGWWWALTGVLLLGSIGVLVALALDRSADPGGTATTTPPAASVGPVAQTAAPTPPPTVAPTPLPTTTTTTPPTTAPPPSTVEGVAAIIAAAPDHFGEKSRDVVNELGQINGRGGDDGQRARQLLERANGWVEEGELHPDALNLLVPVLEPIAAQEGGDGEGDDD